LLVEATFHSTRIGEQPDNHRLKPFEVGQKMRFEVDDNGLQRKGKISSKLLFSSDEDDYDSGGKNEALQGTRGSQSSCPSC